MLNETSDITSAKCFMAGPARIRVQVCVRSVLLFKFTSEIVLHDISNPIWFVYASSLCAGVSVCACASVCVCVCVCVRARACVYRRGDIRQRFAMLYLARTHPMPGLSLHKQHSI
jgi:hypothetical protein